ncbi:MAG: CDP-alcohol phosphatidyltransferase family protein [Methanobacteriaceae archaeon]|nr:CDP-alcohol phosphatidyltransferase family protein [Methanobacteriaceae archaeon]
MIKFRPYIPSAITSIRFIAAPIFFYFFWNYDLVSSFIVLIIALSSDIIDGYLARALDETSNQGAYLDVAADFFLIITCFSGFSIRGWYPPLILLLITVLFILFIATSKQEKPVYDPLGKYLGSILMGIILLSFLIIDVIFRQVMLIIIILFSLVSIITRLLFLKKRI